MISPLLAQMVVHQTSSASQMSWVELAIGVLAILFVLGIVVLILYLLYDAQRAIPPEHRHLEPAQVWLLLIPLFNLVWNFFVYQRIADSYRSYFYSRGRFDVGDAGKSTGLWFAICSACSVIPCIGIVAGIAALILLIVFLVRIHGLKGQLAQLATMPVVSAGPFAIPGGFPVTFAQRAPWTPAPPLEQPPQPPQP